MWVEDPAEAGEEELVHFAVMWMGIGLFPCDMEGNCFVSW